MAVSVAGKFYVIIVGAGPAGLAAEVHINDRYKKWAKSEREKDTPRVLPELETIIIEKSDVTAPLWRTGTYENLTLQCRKSKCALPGREFPKDGLEIPEGCPEYPRRSDFIKYLDLYKDKLQKDPHFNTEVTKAVYLEEVKKWEIETKKHTTEEKTYYCDFLVVASGLCAEPRIPNLTGLADHFPPNIKVDPTKPRSPMKQIHSSKYWNAEMYSGKRVLVVGCGDSGIDICGDLYNGGATPYIVVNSGKKRTEKFYKRAPRVNGEIIWPFKTNLSKLSKDVGNRGQCALGNIDKDCNIEVDACSDIVRFHENSVELSGREANLEIDCVILATGYDHNVNKWLEGTNITFDKTGHLQFGDAVGDNITDVINDKHPFKFKSRISAIGFDSELALHGIKTYVEEVSGDFEK